jgi:hypothetical protein
MSTVAFPSFAYARSQTDNQGIQYYDFSCMGRPMLKKLPDFIKTGIENSNLWEKEQAQGLLATNCLSLSLPRTSQEDTILTIRMGYNAGFELSDLLNLGEPVSLEQGGELEEEGRLGPENELEQDNEDDEEEINE